MPDLLLYALVAGLVVFGALLGRKSSTGIDRSLDIGTDAINKQSEAIEMMREQMATQDNVLEELRAIRRLLEEEKK